MSAQGLFSRLGTLFRARPFQPARHHALASYARRVDRLRADRDPAAPALLLAATELQSGTLRVFCNRAGRPPG